MFDLLPPALLFEFFLRLPPKDLIRCMYVCKSWNAIICNQHFIDAHFDRSIKTNSHRTLVIWQDEIPDPPTAFFSVDFHEDDTFGSQAVKIEQPLKHPWRVTEVLGYCNGLLCICSRHHGDFAVWNPSIQRFKKVPFTPIEQPSDTKQTEAQYGFGYDSTNDDYKFVRMVLFSDRDSVPVSSEVKVYSLKSNSWKRIQNLPHNDLSLYSEGFFLNGALHWLMNHGFNHKRCIVLTLDLTSEKYNEFPTPVDWDDDATLGLEVFGGYLCVYVNHSPARNDVWIMKEYGVTQSWILLYSIEQGALPDCFFEICKPLVFSKSGEMVLLNPSCARLFWYHLKKKRGERVEIPGTPHLFATVICVGNLRLLDCDPVPVERQQRVLSNRRTTSRSEGYLDLLVKAIEDDQNSGGTT